MTWTERSFIVTIQGDSDGQLQDLGVQDVYNAAVKHLAMPTHQVQVREVAGNISVQNSGQPTPQRKRNPKVNASHGMDLELALGIASQEPMSAAQRRHRDGLIVAALSAGVTPATIARHTGLSTQSINLIRRNAT